MPSTSNERVAAIVGKGRKPRIVPFNDETFLALRRYLRTRTGDHDFLWTAQRGSLTRAGVDKMLRSRGKRAGVAGTRAHRFRHTVADRWQTAGARCR